MRIEGRNDKMDEMQCESKIRDQFAPGYEEEDSDDSDRDVRYARERQDIKGLFSIYPRKESSIQTRPSIHPTVVSPRKLRQLSTKSKLKCAPATRAVNRMSTVPSVYHIVCRMRIWLRIFRGGSSISAPGLGGRRRRAMSCVS